MSNPNFVFVLDTHRKPLTPCTPGMARSLLKAGKASVFRMYPFTLVLHKEVQANPKSLTLKLDPGSKVTGIALLQETLLFWMAELTHRGQQIQDALLSRRQQFNRTRLELPKTHSFDAACVGETPELTVLSEQPLLIKATGHGTRQMCRTDKFGFPSRYVPRFKFVQGFQTGDIVKAIVTSGKKVGTYFGRVAVRSTGSFNLSDANGLVQGISHKYCKPIHKKDGYAYGFAHGH
jgi:RRXRR protein